ncbi:MAG: MFS transporter, partial [Bryobacteraceae bacterium]
VLIMKIDLAGPARRGLATGLNEFIGYLGVAAAAWLTGLIAAYHGLRPAPFYAGIGFAILGLALSVFFVRDTDAHVAAEDRGNRGPQLELPAIFALALWRDRTLSAATQAGLVNKINDGLVWGLLPIHFTAAGLAVDRVGIIAATYPAVWGATQLFTGALSDRWGRKRLIVAGMWTQAAAVALFLAGTDFATGAGAAALLGLGTALVYPTLLATVSDVARPSWRASALGVYRFWRDSGYVASALIAGVLADTAGIGAAIAVVAALTFVSGVVVAFRMEETASRVIT